jgi:hypothetical protein
LQPGSVHYCSDPFCRKVVAAKRARRSRSSKQTGEKTTRSGKLPWRGVYGGRTNDPLFSR